MKDTVLKAIKERRSVRSYRPEQITEEEIEYVLEAGMYAASGMGMQSAVMVAVTDKETRDKLSEMNAAVMGGECDPFYGAPAVIVVLADPERSTYQYDGSLVMGNLMLAAHAEGLGSCWIHRAKEEFESEDGKALLRKWGLDEKLVGIGHCILGYPAENPQAKPRKDGWVVRVK